MATVIEGMQSGDEGLTDYGAGRINALLSDAMTIAYGDEWEVVPGGEANGEWNRLVNGNAYDTPTEMQAEYAREELWLLMQDNGSDPKWWESVDISD